MQDSAGIATRTCAALLAPPGAVAPGPKPRMVAATATAIASSVMTVKAPFATDFSARSNVSSTINPKKQAAASVSHIGKVGERQR